MSQNNEDYSKYFEVLDTAIEKLVSTKKQYIDKPNRVNSVLFRKQLLELKTVLGQSRQDVLKVNKAKKPAKIEVEVEKVEPVTVEVVKVESTEPLELAPVELAPVVAQVEPIEPVIVEVTPAIVVVDTEKNKRKARIQPNKKPRQ